MDTIRRLAVLAALLACIFVRPAAATTALSAVRVAPDVTVNLAGTVVTDNDVAEDDLAGGIATINIGAIPAATGITAYDRLATGDQLLSFDTPVELPGGVIAQPGDIVRFDGVTYTLAFDASVNGVPPGTITDALSSLGPDDFLLSFDVTTEIAGVTSHDEDLVRFHGGVVTLFVDGSAAGVPDGVDIDAVHCLDRNAHLLISFDGTGTVPAVTFDDEDVLEYDPAAGLWELSYDGSAEHAGWYGADLEAVAATVTEGAATPPIVGFVSGQGTQVGVALGSTRVFGTGTAHAKPEDGCIAIYEVGANGTPDQPPGSIDDELLGTGGTDAGGAFVDANDMPGIPLSRPLFIDDRLFAADLCEGLRGRTVSVTLPAPALARDALLLLVAILIGVGGWNLRQQQWASNGR